MSYGLSVFRVDIEKLKRVYGCKDITLKRVYGSKDEDVLLEHEEVQLGDRLKRVYGCKDITLKRVYGYKDEDVLLEHEEVQLDDSNDELADQTADTEISR